MSTAAQLAQYCVDHHYTLASSTPTKGTFHMATIFDSWTVGVIAGAVLAYLVICVGLVKLWADIKAIPSLIEGKSTTTSVTVAPTPVVTTTTA